VTSVVDLSPLDAPVDPVRLALEGDIAQVRLLAAADDGRFGVHAFQFPIVLAWVAIGSKHLGIRLDCGDYPTLAPAGSPWDLEMNIPLPVQLWPINGRAEKVFRKDWSPSNRNAPYLACDRIALATHPDWATAIGNRAWNSTKTVFDYLEQMYEALAGASLPAGTRSVS